MYDLLAWQFVGVGDLCIACVAAIKCFAFVQELRSSGSVDCAIHASTAQKGFICSIDYGVSAELGDVGTDE